MTPRKEGAPQLSVSSDSFNVEQFCAPCNKTVKSLLRLTGEPTVGLLDFSIIVYLVALFLLMSGQRKCEKRADA